MRSFKIAGFVRGGIVLALAVPAFTVAQTPEPPKLALGSVIQYTKTPRERNSPCAAQAVAALDLLETKFAARFLGSKFFAYYDRQALGAVQTELDRIDNIAFDKMSGPSRELLKRLDYLAGFSTPTEWPPSIIVIQVETGRVFASEVCGRSGDTACVDTVYRQLLSMASEALASSRDAEGRRNARADLTPQYEQMVGRLSAETSFWDRTRADTRQHALRSEIEQILRTLKVTSDRCAALLRAGDSQQLGSCMASVDSDLNKQ